MPLFISMRIDYFFREVMVDSLMWFINEDCDV